MTTVADELALAAPQLLDTMNGAFEDSILLVGRMLGGRPEATAAKVVDLDERGLDLVVADRTGEHVVRVDFANPIEEVGQFTTEAFALVTRAAELAAKDGNGDRVETTAERELAGIRALRTYLTTVSAVSEVHPHLRLITFGGGDLETFSPLGPDTFLYVLLPPPGRTELTIDQSFSWEEWYALPEDERAGGGYYTLRAWRPEVSELDMLFVLHEPAGSASTWAARAKPGDPVALWGPREAFSPPADTDSYLLVADDTGLPAIATILESLPDNVPVRVVAEVDSAAEQQALRERPGIEVTWVYRDGEAPGLTSDRLDSAVRALPPPSSTTYVWGGGESRMMTAVRRYVRREIGLTRGQVSLVAYWRHATSPDPGLDDA